MKVIDYVRVVGALAIGLSGVLQALGHTDLASAIMILGGAAAAPRSAQ